MNMRKSLISLLLIFSTVSSIAQTLLSKMDSVPNDGVESKSSAFFRDVYLHNDLAHYLDNLSDYVIYETETTGSFNLPDQFTFFVSGNSYRWNKFYLDGFRIDSRFSAGSTAYQPDMYTHSINLEYSRSILNFSTDSTIPNSLALRYNVGGLGGISPTTEKLVNLFHNTASQRMFKPILFRDKMRDAGTVSFNYAIPSGGKLYGQQFYADFGTRMLVGFDETGINSYTPENFFKVQMAGELPIKLGNLFDRTNYLSIVSQRDNLYTEFNYGKDEVAKQNAYSFSFYGNKVRTDYKYTSGFTLATNKVQHANLNFSRNMIDVDGEGLEPWYPDGVTTELSHSLNFTKNLGAGWQLCLDSYNSLIYFSPTVSSFQNAIYARKENVTLDMVMPFQSLYVYNWKSNAFASGLLENALSLKKEVKLAKDLHLKASFDLTYDAMLVASKSMFKPNWQTKLGLSYNPVKWFSTELNFDRNRVSFNIEDIRYFSNDYMNADVYYWKDANGDRQYQESEKSDYFTSTGGRYHQTAGNLRQQSYVVFDMPMYFRFGNHEFAWLNTYEIYYNNVTTRLDKPADQYGTTETNATGDKQIFYFNNGPVNYVVDYYPSSYMKTDKFYDITVNTPHYAATTIKYTYNSERFYCSFSWCCNLMNGVSALGNGPLSNSLGIYSETSANPNTAYKILGRLDQDRSYIGRVLMSYKFTKNLSFGVTGKFKDGVPFTSFDTQLKVDPSGNAQLAMWNARTKGTNSITDEFGTRKDAFFNFDLRAAYKGTAMNHPYEIQMMMYNVYDFGTELTEYTFEPDDVRTRYALQLNIPRGLMVTAKIGL